MLRGNERKKGRINGLSLLKGSKLHSNAGILLPWVVASLNYRVDNTVP